MTVPTPQDDAPESTGSSAEEAATHVVESDEDLTAAPQEDGT